MLFGVYSSTLIEARAAILSTIIVFILFLIYQGYQIIKQVYTVKQGLLNIGFTIVPYFIALFMNIVITNNINRGTITDTVGRIFLLKNHPMVVFNIGVMP